MRSSFDDQELVSSDSTARFDQIPLQDMSRVQSDDLDSSPADRDRDYDLDPAHSGSEGLNSSLTGHAPKSSSLRDRAVFWYRDPANDRSVKIGKCALASVLLFVVILIIAAVTRHSDSRSPESTRIWPVRLPTAVRPDLYTFSLLADMTLHTFTGDMLIDLVFVESTNQVVLHAGDNLLVDQVWLATEGGSRRFQPDIVGPTGQHDLFLVSFGSAFPAGTVAQLHLRYAGAIAEQPLAGFYLSSYKTAAGEVKEIASTHFEATDARRAMPCFDEPAFKANFSVTIVTQPGKVVLSNMPQKASLAPPGNMQTYAFETSVRMSTYLVAWCVTDFVGKSALTQSGINVTVWTAPDKLRGVDVALAAGVAAIDKYDDFFKVAFPLPKMDMIGIPNFPVGAMENWGLVTYRESAMLIFPESAEAMTEQNIVATVAHELAHQWFGNIVTMAWWNDLWLNEGFASFVEYIGMQAYNDATTPPTVWDEQAQMVLGPQTTALGLDSSQYSHSIVQTVNDPEEIDSLFDAITYEKGCSVLSQMASILGYYDNEQYMQNGLEAYLKLHAYGNAQSDDLWAALQSKAPASVTDLTTVMHQFTTQMGYPVLTVRATAGNPAFTVTQSRFVELPYQHQDPALRDTQGSYKWTLYVRWATDAGQGVGTVHFPSTTSSVDVPFAAGSKYLWLNAGRFGFYRVNYDAGMWIALGEGLADADETPFTRSDRVGIVDDAWALALANHTAYASAFAVSAFLGTPANSNDYTTWAAAMDQLGRVARLLDSKPLDRARLDDYVVRKLVNNNPLSLPPWGNQTAHLSNLLQQLLVGSLVAYNDTATRAEANRLFTAFMHDPVHAPVPVNSRDAVYRVGIEAGDNKCWNFLFKQYQDSLDPSEQRRIIRALCRSTNTTTLHDFLDMSLAGVEVKSQDLIYVVVYTAMNRVGRDLAWQWLQTNYAAIFELFGHASFVMSELLTRVIVLFQTQEELDQAQSFFASQSLGTAKQAVKQAFESVQTNIYWLRERYPEFSAELQKQVQ